MTAQTLRRPGGSSGMTAQMLRRPGGSSGTTAQMLRRLGEGSGMTAQMLRRPGGGSGMTAQMLRCLGEGSGTTAQTPLLHGGSGMIGAAPELMMCSCLFSVVLNGWLSMAWCAGCSCLTQVRSLEW